MVYDQVIFMPALCLYTIFKICCQATGNSRLLSCNLLDSSFLPCNLQNSSFVFYIWQYVYSLRCFTYGKGKHSVGERELWRTMKGNITINSEREINWRTIAWKVSAFGIILVHIFPHSDWIGRDTLYLSVFCPNAGKWGP